MGEGPTDVGHRDYKSGQFIEGPVPVIIRKILGEHIEIDLLEKSSRKKSKGKHFQRSIRGLHGQGVYSWWAKMQAAEQLYDVVAFYSDSDRESGHDSRSESACRKRFDEVKSDIEAGFHQADSLNVLDLSIVPVKMIESWLMADPEAFSVAFGNAPKCGKGVEKIFPKRPELEWGDKHDVSSNYPKCQLNRILSCYDKESNQETFVQLAGVIDFEKLRKRCPISFASFYEDLSSLKTALQDKHALP